MHRRSAPKYHVHDGEKVDDFAQNVVRAGQPAVGLPVAAEKKAEGAGDGLQASESEDDEAEIVVRRDGCNGLATLLPAGEGKDSPGSL